MKPFDDKEMYYDARLGKYVLTSTAVINNLFLDENMMTNFKTMSNAKQFLQEISEDIYRYILSHKFVSDRKKFKHVVNTYDVYREAIKRALLYQVRYAFRSGGHALKDMTGVDIERARLISLEKIRGDVGISPSSIEELMTAGLLSTKPLIIRDFNADDGWY